MNVFLAKRIKRLSCFSNCTTHEQPPVRNHHLDRRGSGRPPFNWKVALGKTSEQIIDFLGRLVEAHSGTGQHSFYGESAWPLFRGLLKIYIERETVK